MADLQLKTAPMAGAGPIQARFSPYVSNGGTALGVAGKNFAVIAGDTRMSSGYSILSREVSKIYKLAPHTVLATAGMQAEAATLRKVLDYKITFYDHAHHQEMSCPAVAQMLSNTLYGKRFFPFYTFNVVGGVDAQGAGKVYGYDAVGSFESVPYVVTGSGSALITSLLDNQVGFKTQSGNFRDLSIEETVDLVKDCFTCAGERDIYTGDKVDIAVITSEGVDIITDREPFYLKKD
jgi:20S proteasome subunit beta 6